MQTFREWLEQRDEEAPAAESLATLIAQSGAVGISLDHLRRIAGIRPETVDDLLRALEASGQVTVVKVNGQRVYRATT
jgi:predicted transcriptional regulator